MKAEAPYSGSRLSGEQKLLLFSMQALYPKRILLCFRQRQGRWSAGTFSLGHRFFPRTMLGLWRRGLVDYKERQGGDRLYGLTKTGMEL
jgi:hypothetical protein